MEETSDKNADIEAVEDAEHSVTRSDTTTEEVQPMSSESAMNASPRRVTRSQTLRSPTKSKKADKPPAKRRKTKDDPSRIPTPVPEPSTSSAPFPLDPQLSTHVNEPVDDMPPPQAQVPATHSPMSSQYTFLEQSTFPEPPFQGERRGPRTRIAPPVPVPNLTKRSRGRHVPVGAAGPERDRSRSGRLYMCKVQDCGKCFNRGEHLKRHIRSIHTHDKPFQCTYPSCEKFFSRHDNLLQHQKIHRDYNFSQEPDPLGGTLHRVQQASHADDMPMASSMSIILPHPFATISSFPVSAEPVGFSAHVAVSSLRTELPAASEDAQGQTSTVQSETQFAHLSLSSHFQPPPSAISPSELEVTTSGLDLQSS